MIELEKRPQSYHPLNNQVKECPAFSFSTNTFNKQFRLKDIDNENYV
jgi:hypothetical protein